MKASRMLGICGLTSALVGVVGAYLGYVKETVMLAAFIMLMGNLYATWKD